MIFQNGMILPDPLMAKLMKIIDEYNRSKRREGQRPQWGTHMKDVHVLAFADAVLPREM